MKLKKLLKNFPQVEIHGSKELEIRGIAIDSRSVAPGDLFVAKKGASFDGNNFSSQAVEAGAVAILSDLVNPFLNQVTQVIAPDVSSLISSLSAQLYDFPSQELQMIGITGTNGKTTTAYLLRHFLEKRGRKTGLVGTIEALIGDIVYAASSLTTPEAPICHKLLKEMVHRGCQSCIMEVTSHGLAQGRVSDIAFDIALFTNLTHDHLDYHKTMEEYAGKKRELFRLLEKSSKPLKYAIFNTDSPFSLFMQEGYLGPKLTYGISNEADVKVQEVSLSAQGTKGLLSYKGKTFPFHNSLIGRFNLYNLLAALTVGIASSLSIEEMLIDLPSFSPPSGRLERVKEYKDAHVFIDFAHTEDALENVLEILREIKKGKMIVLFGCGGDRDPFKRPKMAKVAEKYADVTIVTSDNPRTEDPLQICEEIASGFTSQNRYLLEVNREVAIKKALSLANKEDIVLLAGKGHEKTQVCGHKRVVFDERAIVAGYRKEG